jgi:hypothetical protein
MFEGAGFAAVARRRRRIATEMTDRSWRYDGP